MAYMYFVAFHARTPEGVTSFCDFEVETNFSIKTWKVCIASVREALEMHMLKKSNLDCSVVILNYQLLRKTGQDRFLGWLRSAIASRKHPDIGVSVISN